MSYKNSIYEESSDFQWAIRAAGPSSSQTGIAPQEAPVTFRRTKPTSTLEHMDRRPDLREIDCDRRHACPHCPQRFKRGEHLRDHIRIHTGEHPFECNRCGKAFRKQYNRDDHVRVGACAASIRPRTCRTCCEVFPTYEQKSRHQRDCIIHIEEAPPMTDEEYERYLDYYGLRWVVMLGMASCNIKPSGRWAVLE